MRRLAPECFDVDRAQRGWRQLLDRVDAEDIIGVLEPLVTAHRQDRLQRVFAQRLESVTVLMDAPHNPHNGAAVLRSCDAFGICRMHVVERTESFVANGSVAKGTERWVEVVAHPTVDVAEATLSTSRHALVAAHPEGELLPSQLADVPRLALVLGNEHDGIHGDLLAACERRVRVPMRGFVESLNVSVTAAILLAHATAGRAGDLPAHEQRRWYARALIRGVRRAREILRERGLLEP